MPLGAGCEHTKSEKIALGAGADKMVPNDGTWSKIRYMSAWQGVGYKTVYVKRDELPSGSPIDWDSGQWLYVRDIIIGDVSDSHPVYVTLRPRKIPAWVVKEDE